MKQSDTNTLTRKSWLRISIFALLCVAIASVAITALIRHVFFIPSQTKDLVTIFLTGLLTGGLTCMAVQGGLLATTIAQREEERLQEKVKNGNALPIIAFLLAKLVAYTIFGFLLGWFGSFLQLSITTRLIMQVVISVFMIGT